MIGNLINGLMHAVAGVLSQTLDEVKARRRNATDAMKRFVTVILAVCVLMLPGKSAAMTRMALVIGNSTYVAANPLPNPANDASALAKIFRDAKFDVVETMLDLSRDGFLLALREFADRSVEADSVGHRLTLLRPRLSLWQHHQRS
jgi:hypothetical protein